MRPEDIPAAIQRATSRYRRMHDSCASLLGFFVSAMVVCLGLVGIGVGIWLLLFPDDDVAEMLADDGVRVNATACERHLSYQSRDALGTPGVENGNWIYDAVRVTFEADGSRVTAQLARLNEHSDDLYERGLQAGWQQIPGDADYACPLTVVHDPDDPDTVMAAADVDYYAGDRDRNDRFILLVVMLVLLAPSLPALVWFLQPLDDDDEEPSEGA